MLSFMQDFFLSGKVGVLWAEALGVEEKCSLMHEA